MGIFGNSSSKSSSSSSVTTDASTNAAQDQAIVARGSGVTAAPSSPAVSLSGVSAYKGAVNLDMAIANYNYDPEMYRQFMELTGDTLSQSFINDQIRLEASFQTGENAFAMVENMARAAVEQSGQMAQVIADAYNSANRPPAPEFDYNKGILIGGAALVLVGFFAVMALRGRK